jgi:hypothetical protein
VWGLKAILGATRPSDCFIVWSKLNSDMERMLNWQGQGKVIGVCLVKKGLTKPSDGAPVCPSCGRLLGMPRKGRSTSFQNWAESVYVGILIGSDGG